jgi:hypothetical protein
MPLFSPAYMGVNWMRTKQLNISSLLILLALVVTIPLSSVRAQDETPPEETPQPTEASVDVVNDYYTTVTTRTADGTLLTVDIINGPPEPPDPIAMEASRVAVSSLDRAATLLPSFPSYDWVYGCSAVSGAMIAGYYDNQGYSNMYAGPTNGGVMPQTDLSWGTWSDGYSTYPNNPLIASRNGLDGYVGYGSIEDYWFKYDSLVEDPYITDSRIPHTSESAVGDFMKTSQSAYSNRDGGTWFYNYEDSPEKLLCSTMENSNLPDGTLGRKKFYEKRGYTVTDCFNQYTDNNPAFVGGFSLANFQAEIDAGHPVFINLVGHSVVGFGYEGDKIYIHDTWNSNPSTVNEMLWGGSYQGMEMLSVSIVHFEGGSPVLSKLSPVNQLSGLDSSLTLSWGASSDAVEYEYCLDTDTNCSNWISTGTNTSIALSGLASETSYYWQVRARDGASALFYADDGINDHWQFTIKELPSPAFSKLSPADQSSNLNPSSVTLSWGASNGAASYEYCLSDSASCSSWISNGGSTSVTLHDLTGGATFYWQVRAKDGGDSVIAYADGLGGVEGVYWNFTTSNPALMSEQAFIPLILK